MKYVGAGGEVYLNGKLISNYKAAAATQRYSSLFVFFFFLLLPLLFFIHSQRHIVCINQWVLFEEPPNTLGAVFKYPELDFFTDVLPKLTIQFKVRDWNDETWISVGHKIRFTLSTITRDPTVVVLPDKEKTDEILHTALLSRKKSRMYLSFNMKFSVFGSPYPLWCWAPAEPFAAGVETSHLRVEVFEATYNMCVLLLYGYCSNTFLQSYRMFVERRDADLKATFTPLLKDLAYSSQKISKCNGLEAKAIDELWQSCFLTWLEDPNYKLTHMSKKDKEYRIATCGKFVTLVTPKDDWPIIFTSRSKKGVPGIFFFFFVFLIELKKAFFFFSFSSNSLSFRCAC